MSRFESLVANKSAKDGKMYKQVEIAKAIGVSNSMVSRLMNSENLDSLTLRMVKRICEWLECDIADLLYIDREKEDESA